MGQGRTKGIVAVCLTLVVGLAAPGGASAATASASVEATVNLGGLLPLPLPPLPGGSCALCANFVTTHDADGTAGPAAPFTRMHRDVVSNVPYALDVDGQLPPIPLGLLPVPGYELRATVEALSADRPTVTLAKLATALPRLPLRAEIVTGDVSDPAAPKTTFGYDTLDATAPQSFKAALDLTDRDANAATTNAFADLTIATSANRLTVVTEGFTGAPDGDRTERNIRRLTYRGDPGKGTAVPTRASIDVAAAVASQRVILTRDLRTTLDVEVVEAVLGRRLTATLDELPTRADLTIEDTDVNADGSVDKKATYLANATVKNATLRLEDGGAVSRAAVTDLPSDVKLTYASLDNGTPTKTTDDGTAVTYKSNGRATHAELRREDGPRVLNASLDKLPATITDLSYLPTVDGGHVVYTTDGRATTGTVEVTDGATTPAKRTKATLANVPSTMDLTWGSTDAGGFAHYFSSAGHVADQAKVELDDEEGQKTTIDLTKFPSTVNVDYVKADDKLDFDYSASSEVPVAEIHGLNFKGLPSSAKDLHLVLKRVPTGVSLLVTKLDKTTSKVNELPPPEICQHIPEEEAEEHPHCPQNPDYTPLTETITTVTKDSDLEVTTPGGRLGSGEIQMTSGPDWRLPEKAARGNPQDGVLLQDFGEATPEKTDDTFVAFARVSEFDKLILKRHKQTSHRSGPGLPRPDSIQESLHAELDTDPSVFDHALVLDIDKESANAARQKVVKSTDGLLVSLPAHVEFDQSTSSALEEKHITWSSSRPVDGYWINQFDGIRQPGFTLTEHESVNGAAPERKSLATLDPMPTSFQACQHIVSECSNETFDENLSRLESGDYEPSLNPPPPTYRCFGNGCAGGKEFPVRPGLAYKGGARLEASPATTLNYESGGTSVHFARLERFVLQAHQDTYECLLGQWTCRIGYIALDSGDKELVGSITQESDGKTTYFNFPERWKALNHVWAFHETGPKQGEVATIGPVTCPDGTIIQASGDNHTTKFCDGHLTEWDWINF